MRYFLIAIFFTGVSVAKDIPVKDELATMLEDIIVEVGFSVNISGMTETTVNINKINGVDVCDKEIKFEVLELQDAFNQHPNIRKTISTYSAYFKKEDGSVVRTDRSSSKFVELVGDCKLLYVAVF